MMSFAAESASLCFVINSINALYAGFGSDGIGMFASCIFCAVLISMIVVKSDGLSSVGRGKK
jgi:hypothetical protein